MAARTSPVTPENSYEFRAEIQANMSARTAAKFAGNNNASSLRFCSHLVLSMPLSRQRCSGCWGSRKDLMQPLGSVADSHPRQLGFPQGWCRVTAPCSAVLSYSSYQQVRSGKNGQWCSGHQEMHLSSSLSSTTTSLTQGWGQFWGNSCQRHL